MKAYEKELLDNSTYFIETPSLNEEVERVIAQEAEQRMALMVYSPVHVGKNLAFRNALNKKEGNKIFINFNDLSYMSAYPAYYFVKTIYDKLDEYGIKHKGDFPDVPPSTFELDVELHYDALLGTLKRDLYCLELETPLYILIANCDAPFDNDFSLTFYNHFVLDKRRLPDNLHVFFITSSNKQVEVNKTFLEIANIEGNKDNPKLFFKELMNRYSRTINDELLLLANPSLTISDYLYIAGYVINYCGMKESDFALRNLLSKNNTDEILLYIFDDFYSRLTKYGRIIFAEALIDLYMVNLGLTKDQILNSGRYLLHKDIEYLRDYEEISRDEKEIILANLEFFTKEEGDRLVISDKIIRDFIGTNAMLLTNLVCEDYKDRLLSAVDHIYNDKDYIERVRYSPYEYIGETKYQQHKDTYIRDLELEERISKKNVARYAVFNPLCDRLGEYLLEHTKEAPEVEREKISEEEVLLITYAERASVIYLSGLDYANFEDLLSNKNLMYLLASKSRRMVRRILNRYIQMYIAYQKRILKGREDKVAAATTLQSIFDYLFDEDKKYYQLQEELIVMLGEVLRENDVLINGKVKDFFNGYKVTPVTDFALMTGDEQAVSDLNVLYEDINEKVLNLEYIMADLLEFSKKYEEKENVYHKLLYAYLSFRAFAILGENKMANKALAERLNPIVEDVLVYSEFCFFPEVYGMIYAYFGRMYPQEHLERLETGVNLLISQGYQRSINYLIQSLNYFSSLKIKEGK